jgi:hypothetical protein
MIRGLALLIAGVALFACGLVAPAIVGSLSSAGEPPTMRAGAGAVAPRTAPRAPSQLRAALDAIAPRRKLLLGGGDVLAVAASCTASDVASPARCLTLYDLDDLSFLTLDRDLAPAPESMAAGKPSERLRSLLDAAAITPVLRDFLRDAPLE